MMPGIGFAEMVLLALVAIVVIGPKDLPLMMRRFGQFTGKMRALAFEFKQGFDELGRQAELEELRKEVAELKKHTGMDELQRELAEDEANLRKDVDSAMAPASLPPASAPAHPAGAANGEAQPAPVAPYAGLSPDHPGYDTGEGSLTEPAPPPPTEAASEAAKEEGPDPEPAQSAESKGEPLKQGATA